MSDTIGVNGLETKTLTELIDELTVAFQTVYGADINLDPNSPDGQIVNILAQEGIDLRELLALINADFDPDQAEGTILDQRVAINNIKRNAGTYSTVDVEIVVDRALSLVGLDSQADTLNPNIPNLYTGKDNAGNLYYLLESQAPASAGTYTYAFRAASIGAVIIPASSVTTASTIIAGVVSINNPNPATVQGSNEETDTELKIRRRKSTANSSVGLDDSVEGALAALPGVIQALVVDNPEDTTDAFGTPAHTMWAIVDGGTPSQIAQVIYAKRSLGCGMRGSETYDIPRTLGRFFTAKWDIPNNVNLWIHFTLSLPGGTVDSTFIKNQIVNNVFWELGNDAVNDIISGYVRTINPNYRVTAVLLSDDNVTFTEIVATTSPRNRFVNAASRIVIT